MNYGKSNVVKKHKELVSTPRRLTTKIMVYMFKVSIFAVLLAVGAAGFLGLGLIKGIIDAVICFVVYKKLSPILKTKK